VLVKLTVLLKIFVLLCEGLFVVLLESDRCLAGLGVKSRLHSRLHLHVRQIVAETGTCE